jgi:hypothetical protein
VSFEAAGGCCCCLVPAALDQGADLQAMLQGHMLQHLGHNLKGELWGTWLLISKGCHVGTCNIAF